MSPGWFGQRSPFWLGQEVLIGSPGSGQSRGVVKGYRAGFTVLVERLGNEHVYCSTRDCHPVEPLLDKPGGRLMLSYSIDAIATPTGVNFILKNDRGTPIACGGRDLIRVVELSAHYHDTLDQLLARLEFRGLLQLKPSKARASA